MGISNKLTEVRGRTHQEGHGEGEGSGRTGRSSSHQASVGPGEKAAWDLGQFGVQQGVTPEPRRDGLARRVSGGDAPWGSGARGG